MRVTAFQTENSAGQGNYYSGLAGVFPRTCAAPDDISRQLGDPAEAAIKAALDFLAGRACTPITATAGIGTQSAGQSRLPLRTDEPSASQRDAPGSF